MYPLAYIYTFFICLFTADYKSEREGREAWAEALRTGLVNREALFVTTKASLIKERIFL